MVSVALRGEVAVFSVAENPMLAEPAPFAPLVIVSHASLLVAAHVQPSGAVTSTVPLEAPEATLGFSGDAETAHGTGNSNESVENGLDVRPPDPTAATAAL